MRNWKTSIYKKTVGISLENYQWIIKNKKKKSIAGMVNEIINNAKKI
ncbi:MAG: hypothetical protein NUV65_06835 [Candidatus Roizmanbacteria bacterium]|nr:hypothetical protein [Candidatus Roizmanbacteria bacterium]